jgi:hypothetical protein
LNAATEKKLGTLSETDHFLDSFINDLENIVNNKMGPLWQSKNTRTVKTGVARLMLIEKEWRRADGSLNNYQTRFIEKKLSRVRQLISQYIMILEGSLSIVREEISRINKAKKIRGYRFKDSVRVSGGQLC